MLNQTHVLYFLLMTLTFSMKKTTKKKKKKQLVIKVKKLYNWLTSKKLSFNTVKKIELRNFPSSVKATFLSNKMLLI